MIYKAGSGIWRIGDGVRLSRPAAAGGGGGDWWDIAGQTCVAAYQPIGAASLEASYADLSGNGNDADATGHAPTWNSTDGWIFTAINTYLDTGIVPDAGYSMIFRFSDTATSEQRSIGIKDLILNTLFSLNSYQSTFAGGGDYGSGEDNFRRTTSKTGTAGVFALAGPSFYRNAVQVGTDMDIDWNATLLSIYIGVINIDGSPSSYNNTDINIQAVAIYSTTLTADDVAALTTRIQALS